jgi:transcriptional regulator with XRE-family HTH domain
MQIDSKRIRAEREQRAWSQEHLAEAAGLALRTVQRVEANGAASYETARALAAVFALDVAALRVMPAPPEPRTSTLKRRAGYLGAAASLVLAACFVLFTRSAIAAEVVLDVGLSIDGVDTSRSRVVTVEGKDAEIRLEGQLRVTLMPTINEDGSVALAIRVFEFSGTDFVLVSQPKMFVADNKRADVHVTSPRGSVIRLAITPHKI